MEERKQGSIVVLILWIIFIWPIAIWYWFSRVWSKEMFNNIIPEKEMPANQTNKVATKDKTNKSKGDK